MHESQTHEDNCFLTLTYDDDHLPQHGSLRYRDFQLFMKRFRKKYGKPIRFFMCGEYGEQFRRPHFHACIFGHHFADRVPFKQLGSGHVLYTSAELSSLWTDGFASVGELSFDSAAYVARYVLKKVTGDAAAAHYAKLSLDTGEIVQVNPEFCHMSLKPGIGAKWFERFKSDVFEHDYVVINGVKAKPPRYYDKCLTVLDPDTAEFMELVRYRKTMACASDNSDDRLRVREIVTRARLSSKIRPLE